MRVSNPGIALRVKHTQRCARPTPVAIVAPMLLLSIVLLLTLSLGCTALLTGKPPSADGIKDAAEQKARDAADAKVDEAKERAMRESGLDDIRDAGLAGRRRIEGARPPTPKEIADARAARAARAADLEASRGGLLRWPWGKARKQEKTRNAATQLPKGPWSEGRVRCGSGRCDDWYWLYIADPARIVVEAKGPADSALPDFGLALHDKELEVIGSSFGASGEPRRIDGDLEPGLYYVRVSVKDKSDIQLSYKLRATDYVSRPRPAKAARRARPRSEASSAVSPTSRSRTVPSISSELLEVEWSGGEPVAVLLEVGLGDGIRTGLTGELVEGKKVIGRIEIVGVFSGGSRARIVGGVKQAISLDTTARVFTPSP